MYGFVSLNATMASFLFAVLSFPTDLTCSACWDNACSLSLPLSHPHPPLRPPCLHTCRGRQTVRWFEKPTDVLVCCHHLQAFVLWTFVAMTVKRSIDLITTMTHFGCQQLMSTRQQYSMSTLIYYVRYVDRYHSLLLSNTEYKQLIHLAQHINLQC